MDRPWLNPERQQVSLIRLGQKFIPTQVQWEAKYEHGKSINPKRIGIIAVHQCSQSIRSFRNWFGHLRILQTAPWGSCPHAKLISQIQPIQPFQITSFELKTREKLGIHLVPSTRSLVPTGCLRKCAPRRTGFALRRSPDGVTLDGGNPKGTRSLAP